MHRYAILLSFSLPLAAAAQTTRLPPAQQIALAVLPLPKEFRGDATVLGYDASHKLVPLRQGKGAMVCLADDYQQKDFHVACYHRSLEAFMARGRALRASGVTAAAKIDSVRFADVTSGRITMPKQTGALWQMTGPRSGVDVKNASTSKAIMTEYTLYMPGATPETTGIPAVPTAGSPWLMFPGTPKAHVMFDMSM